MPTRTRLRTIVWIRWPLTALVLVALAIRLVPQRTVIAHVGRFHVAIAARSLVLTTADRPYGGNGERWSFKNGATVILGPPSLWRPSSTTATVSTTTWSATLRSVYVPWVFVLGLAAPLAGLLWWCWWRGRPSVPAGCCAACGYVVWASRSPQCPECGTDYEIDGDS